MTCARCNGTYFVDECLDMDERILVPTCINCGQPYGQPVFVATPEPVIVNPGGFKPGNHKGRPKRSEFSLQPRQTVKVYPL